MVEWIVAIAGAITGVGGFIFGIVKWRAGIKKETTEKIITDKIDAAIAPVTRRQCEMKEQLDDLQAHQEESELCRIRAEIMDAVTEIENGMELGDVMHQHLESEYERYKKHHGNSYIDHQMEKIRNYFRDKDKK